MAKAESRIKAQAKYDASHCKHYSLKYNIFIDKEVVEKLSSVPNMQGYIRQLVREDLSRTGSVPVPEEGDK